MHKYLNELLNIDKQYKTKEQKNYNLVHKYNDLLKSLNSKEINVLQNLILSNFEYSNYKSFLEYVSSCSSFQNIRQAAPLKNEKKETNLSIIDFYDKFDENLISFVKGHLFLENAMNLILKKINLNSNTKFSVKISLLHKHKRIDDNMKTLLKEINKVRNSIAHNLYYELTYNKVFKLVKLSSIAGVDYSDDTIYENKLLSKEWYNVDGLILELFPNTFSYLLELNEDLFPNNEIYNFIA